MEEGEEEDSLVHFVSATYTSSDVTNVIVCSITVSVMVFYVVSYIMISVFERKKLPQGRLNMPSGDTLDSDSYYYVVTVGTGLRPGASLPCQGLVQITLRGSASNSCPLIIQNFENSGHGLFLQRGNIDRFLLPVPACLGEVKKVDIDLYTLQHESINWYVKYVRVTDVHYGTITDFVFDRWLRTCDHLRTGVHQSYMPLCRRIGERFLSIFLDLHVWTTSWTQTSDNSAFARSTRVSFLMMTLSCLMLANLLVCLIPVLRLQRFGMPLPDQTSLIHDALVYGVVANLVVVIVQYLVEVLLRRVRMPVDYELSVRGRDIWSKRPLPPSLYKVIDGSDSDADTTDGYNRDTAKGKRMKSSANKKTGRRSRASEASTLRDVNDPWDESWSNEFQRLESVPEYVGEENLGYQEGPHVSSYFADDEVQEVTQTEATPTCGCYSKFTDNSNMNANKPETKDNDMTIFTNMVNSLLWGEEDGVISSYIKKHEHLAKESSQPRTCGAKHQQDMANYIVSLVLDEAKEAIVFESDPCIGRLQEAVYKRLEEKTRQKTDVLQLLRASSEGNNIPEVHSHSSEGQINIQGAKQKNSRPLAVTSSCPEVQSPNPSVSDASVKYGPVATRLSDTVTAIALRNSFSSLQQNATNKLVSQSKERIASFTSLVREENLSEFTSMKPSYPDTGVNDAPTQRSESANVKTLMESISGNRADRLTEDSMRYIAKASLSSLVSQESLAKLRDTALDYNDKAVQSFTFEVVNNLYNIVRAKLDALVETNLRETEGLDNKSRRERISEFLCNADAEIRSSVLPPLEDYITSLLVDQAKSLEDIDLDLVMTAFSGQYIDTIITNAVLQTHVGLLKARRSLEQLRADGTNTDSNVNNNQDAAIKQAISQLEKTTELEHIVDQLCDRMLKVYRYRKCCTAEHTGEINEAIKMTFRKSAETYEVFDKVMAEAYNYLKLLSEHCDMAAVQENKPLMSRLSDTFLVAGLDVDTHTTLTEELSSKFLDSALDSAYAVVAEQLIHPFLHPDQKILKPRAASATVDDRDPGKPRSILKGFHTEMETSSSIKRSKSPKKKSRLASPTKSSGSPQRQTLYQQATKSYSPGRGRESRSPRVGNESEDWVTASSGSPKHEDTTQSFGSSPGSPSRKSPKRKRLVDSLLDKGPPPGLDSPDGGNRSYVQSPDRFSPYSPMRSSTPRSDSEQSESVDTAEPWSPMRGSFNAIGLSKKTSSDGLSGTGAVFGDTSVTSSLSIPLLPKDSETVLTYDQDLSQILRGKTPGHLYSPHHVSSTSLILPSDENNKIWQLNLEREIMGEPSKCLPACTIHVLQALLIVTTVAALSLCILFGLQLPNRSAIAWVVALSSGVLQHAFLWEIQKIIVVSFYYVTCFDYDI